MQVLGYILVGALGILNIALNTAAVRTAKNGASLPFLALFGTGMFWITFAIGSLALVVMLAMYRSGIPLPRGILMAGATSIVIGTVWSAWQTNASLTSIEWLLWAAIACFYGIRLVAAFK